MEEIEISSWVTLDAIKKKADVAESVGNLQTGHSMSVFCSIEDDYLELIYSDATANTLRRFEDKDEFEKAIEERKEEDGEAVYDEEHEIDPGDDDLDEDEDGDFELEEDSDGY
jgi:hypothetical protein